MKISIIVISDLHIKKKSDALEEKFCKLYEAVKNRHKETDNTIILIPGDIAYSGNSSEYDIALNFFTLFKDKLKKYSKKPVYFVVAPGNHDCDFSKTCFDRKVYKDYILNNSEFETEDIKRNEIIEKLTSVQEDFFIFNECITDSENKIYDDKLVSIYNFKFNNKNVNFISYNFSWISEKEEAYGKNKFPINYYYNNDLLKKSDFSIFITHHPINWFNYKSRMELTNFFYSKSDVLITGHEHDNNSSKIINKDNNETLVFKSGEFNNYNNMNSEFRYLIIDFNENKVLDLEYKFKNNRFVCDKNERWQTFKVKNKNRFEINPDFKDRINDVGANFSHFNKSDLQLNDIFIYPDLELSKEKNDSKDKEIIMKAGGIISSKKLLDNEIKRAIIKGGEKSGKTALLNKLFIDFYELDNYPILISYEDFIKIKPEKLKNELEKIFLNIYVVDSCFEFMELDYSKIIILIDDLSINNRNKNLFKVLELAENNFEKVLITTDEFFNINDFCYFNSYKNETFNNYLTYEICQFNNVFKKDLIKKWLSMGSFNYEIDYQKSIINYIKLVDEILEYRLVPAYPFFLLTLIQTIDVGNSNELKNSSYGHYYDYLIKDSFKRVRIVNEEIISSYNTLLSYLAFYCYDKETYYLEKNEIDDFFYKYRKKYLLIDDNQKVINNLVKAKILDVNNDIYKFRYKYLNFYFTGKYLANKIGEDKVNIIIENMINNSHNKFYGNVLMFLIHFTPNNYIVDAIVNSSKMCFKDYVEVTLDKDIDVLNSLINYIPEMVMKNLSFDELINEKETKKDNNYNKENDVKLEEFKEKKNKFDKKEESLDSINRAIKNIELMGAIAKRYYGSFPIEQIGKLIDEAVSLSLRLINLLIEALSNNIDEIADRIAEILIEDNNEVTEANSKEIARDFIFKITLDMIHSLMFYTTKNIGLKELDCFYQNTLNQNESLAKEMLYLGIQSTVYGCIKEKRVYEFNESTKNNILANIINKRFTMYYLYYFENDNSKIQQVCDKLEIATQKNHLLKIKYKEKEKEIKTDNL